MKTDNFKTKPAGFALAAVGGAALMLALSTSASAAMDSPTTGPVVAGPVVERAIAADMRPGAFGEAQRTYPARVEGNAWTTGGDIDTTQAALDELRKQDESQAPKGAQVRAFGLAKAQCWIDLARHTYREVALTGMTETSLAVARRQLASVAGKVDKAELETPELQRGSDTAFAGMPQVAGVREDLWQRLIGYRTAKGLRCAPALIPCMETDLVEAGYEVAANLRPVSHAGEAIDRAEERAGQIDQALAACTEPVVVAPPPPPPPPVAPAPRRFTLSGATLFKFDGWKPAALLPGGRREIENIAAQLKGDYTRIDRIEVVGHTDRMGSSAYNIRLSTQRAQTVAQMLRGLGVKSAAMQVRGVGEADPVSQNCSAKLPPKVLHDCLQPDRRVVIDVTGETR